MFGTFKSTPIRYTENEEKINMREFFYMLVYLTRVNGFKNFFEKVVFCIRMFAKGYRIGKLKLPDSKPNANGNYFDFERF